MQILPNDKLIELAGVGDFVTIPAPSDTESHVRYGQIGIIQSINDDGTAIIMDSSQNPLPIHISRLEKQDTRHMLLLLERHMLVEAAVNGFCDEV